MPTVIFSSINSPIDNLNPLKVLPMGNPNIFSQANFFENVFLYRYLFRYNPEYQQTKKCSQKGFETHSTPRGF